MKPKFDNRFFKFLSDIESFSSGKRALFKLIAKSLKWKIITFPLAIIEKIIGAILVIPIPVYSHIIYLFIKHCPGFLGYYIRAIYYSMKAKKWGGNIIIDEDVILENINQYEFDEFIQIDKRVIIGCDSLLIGKGVHIAMGTIIGKGGHVSLLDFSGISYGCILIPCTEKISNRCGPMIPYKERKLINGCIILEKESIVFSGGIVFPNTVIGEGAVTSAGYIANKRVYDWKIMFNNAIKQRKKINSPKPKY